MSGDFSWHDSGIGSYAVVFGLDGVDFLAVCQVQTIEKIVEIPLEHSLAQKLCTSFSKRVVSYPKAERKLQEVARPKGSAIPRCRLSRRLWRCHR